MGTENVNISIKRGDTWSRELVFSDEHGAAIDITGWNIFITVKEKIDDDDASAKIAKTITTLSDPTCGKAEISLTSSDTNQVIGSYVFDIQVKTNVGEIYTLVEGIVNFTKDVTQRTS